MTTLWIMSDTEGALNGGRVCDSETGHAFLGGKLNEVLPVLLNDEEVMTPLEVQNTSAVTHKGHGDHGPKHIEIALNRALRLYDLLKADGCEFNDAVEQGLDEVDEPVIAVLTV